MAWFYEVLLGHRSWFFLDTAALDRMSSGEWSMRYLHWGIIFAGKMRPKYWWCVDQDGPMKFSRRCRRGKSVERIGKVKFQWMRLWDDESMKVGNLSVVKESEKRVKERVRLRKIERAGVGCEESTRRWYSSGVKEIGGQKKNSRTILRARY